MGEFSFLAIHETMAVVSIGFLFLLTLVHAIMSCGDFSKVKYIDNNLRLLLT